MTRNIAEEGQSGRGLSGITSFVKDKLAGSIPLGNVWDQGRSLDFSKHDFDQLAPDQATELAQELVAELQEHLLPGWSPVVVLEGKPRPGNPNRTLTIVIANPLRKESVPSSDKLVWEFLKEAGMASFIDHNASLKEADYKPVGYSFGHNRVTTRALLSSHRSEPTYVQKGVAIVSIYLQPDDKKHAGKPLFSSRPAPAGSPTAV
jgi:hypothetical protein